MAKIDLIQVKGNIQYDDIKKMIVDPYYSRGKTYCKDGLVFFVTISRDVSLGIGIKAKVFGGRLYKVELSYNKGFFGGTCSCPAFSDFGPCKHLAGTWFAYVDYSNNLYSSSEECLDAVERYKKRISRLSRKSKAELIEMLSGKGFDEDDIGEYE